MVELILVRQEEVGKSEAENRDASYVDDPAPVFHRWGN